MQIRSTPDQLVILGSNCLNFLNSLFYKYQKEVESEKKFVRKKFEN